MCQQESPYALEAKIFGCMGWVLFFLFVLAVLFSPGMIRTPDPVPIWFMEMMLSGAFGVSAFARFLYSLKPRTRCDNADTGRA